MDTKEDKTKKLVNMVLFIQEIWRYRFDLRDLDPDLHLTDVIKKKLFTTEGIQNSVPRLYALMKDKSSNFKINREYKKRFNRSYPGGLKKVSDVSKFFMLNNDNDKMFIEYEMDFSSNKNLTPNSMYIEMTSVIKENDRLKSENSALKKKVKGFKSERKKYNNKINTLKSSLIKYQNLFNSTMDCKNDIESKLTEKMEKFHNLQKKVKELKDVNTSYSEELSRIQDNINNDYLKNLNNFQAEIEKQNRVILEKQNIIGDIYEKVKKYKRNFVQTEVELRKINLKNMALDSKINNMDEEIDLVYYSVVDGSDLRNSLVMIEKNVKQSLEEIENLINKFH